VGYRFNYDIDTPMSNFQYQGRDPDEKVPNIYRNIIDDTSPNFHRQLISGPNAHLLNATIKARLDTLGSNLTRDVHDRPANRKIVDLKLVFKFIRLVDRSVEKLTT
jgi:hypothetical protein